MPTPNYAAAPRNSKIELTDGGTTVRVVDVTIDTRPSIDLADRAGDEDPVGYLAGLLRALDGDEPLDPYQDLIEAPFEAIVKASSSPNCVGSASRDSIEYQPLNSGIHSPDGTTTFEGYTASPGHKAVHAEQFADWGVDYPKYDNWEGNSGRYTCSVVGRRGVNWTAET